jgi:hypothetical protein
MGREVRLGDEVWVLVPLMALSIPLAAVVGRVVVKPIVDAISKLPAMRVAEPMANATRDEYVQALEDRVTSLERTLAQVRDEQEFQRRLLTERAPGARPAETRPMGESTR